MQSRSRLARGQTTTKPFVELSRLRKHNSHQAHRAQRHAFVAQSLGLGSHTMAPQRRQRLHSLSVQQPLRLVRTATASNDGAAAPASQPTAGAVPPENGSTAGSIPTQAADGRVTTDEIDVRQILSDPGIEGDPLQFLRVTEAYWKVQTACSCMPCVVLASSSRWPVQGHSNTPTNALLLMNKRLYTHFYLPDTMLTCLSVRRYADRSTIQASAARRW
jgi:hypothetical protein